jgi:hypothetical protein
MSTDQPHQTRQLEQPHQDASPRVARRRTPEQTAAWEKVERERAEAAARPSAPGVHPVVVARVVIGVLMAAAALTTFFAMAPDEPYAETRSSISSPVDYLDLISAQQERSDDRRDALLVIAMVGVGAVVATSGMERRTPSAAAGPPSRTVGPPS